MTNWEEYSFGTASLHALPEDRPNTLAPPPPPMSPESKKRFIVEPQVLNAALEVDTRRYPAPPSPRNDNVPSSGLPPPPRPHGRKDRQQSTPSSPATSGNRHSIASIQNSPLSSSYSNYPETSCNPENGVKPSPRLSNIFRGEAILFSHVRRQSPAVPDDDPYDSKDDEQQPSSSADRLPCAPSDFGYLGSPQGSLPSSPEIEMAAVPVDGSRPGRQNRYLISGLQKITKLGRSRGSISNDGEVRSARRMSDADVIDSRRRAKKGSEDLSSRYRRILDKSVKTVGEVMLIKPSTSVPSSPISSSAVKDVAASGEGETESARKLNREGNRPGRFGSFSRGGGTSPSATTSATTTAVTRASPVASPARVWGSHGRLPSELSSSAPSASETSHDPPSSFSSGPRISISSTIYPPSFNSHSFDIPRYLAHTPPPMPLSTTSPDRDSFIDLASPSLSPRTPEFASIPNTVHHSHSSSSQSRSIHSIDSSVHGKFPSSPSSDSNPPKLQLARLIPLGSLEKPPIPTAPKPDFSRRPRSLNRPSPVQSKKSGSGSLTNDLPVDLDVRPPTMTTPNILSPKERAGRIRTTRKLAQVFGQPPGVPSVSQLEAQDVHLSNGCMPLPSPLTLNLSAKRKAHRPAASVSDDVANSSPVYDTIGGMVWPPPEGTRYVSIAPRRHSAPLSPDEFSFMIGRSSYESDVSTAMDWFDHDPSSIIHAEDVHPTRESGSVSGSRRSRVTIGPGSPRSFIDLSDEEATVETPRVSRGRSHPFSPSTASLADSVSSEQLAEDERRRKREKLAKLHRFLGSRVPSHLVLGPLNEGTPLPPPASLPYKAPRDDEGDIRKIKMRRRRSSSAAEFSRTWSDDIDRLKEELNEHEKAINVRRAVKMEKMFGVAPPQTLYHTRAPIGSSLNIPASLRQCSPAKSSPKSPSTPPPFRFSPSSGPLSKSKSKKRPDTAESSKPLIDNDGFLDVGQSSVYMHYRHSLNSLNDIIDRDDKESLAELHDYLTGEHYMTGEQYDYQFTTTMTSGNTPMSTSPFLDDITGSLSPKSERRRSLPSRMSVTSFTSEISTIASPTVPETSFQQRRRRAAKLTHFFGVDYRDLMSEILESIEKGLEEERGKGTLKPDEVKDLLQKLVSLKTKRNTLS